MTGVVAGSGSNTCTSGCGPGLGDVRSTGVRAEGEVRGRGAAGCDGNWGGSRGGGRDSELGGSCCPPTLRLCGSTWLVSAALELSGSVTLSCSATPGVVARLTSSGLRDPDSLLELV